MPLPSLKSNLRSMADRMRVSNAALADKGGKTNKSLVLPPGVRAFKAKGDTTYQFDILAYLVTRNDHPAKIPAGEGWYHTMLFTHQKIGSQELTFACSKLNFGKPCAVCEEITRLRKDTSSDHKLELKAFRAKDRFLMYVVLHDNLDEGIFLLDQSDFMFGAPLREQITMQADEIGDFTDIKDGHTLKVKFANAAFKDEASGDGGSFAKPTAFVFAKKKNKYPAELIKQIEALPSLDSLIKFTPYEEMKAALDGYVPPVGDLDHDDPPPPDEHAGHTSSTVDEDDEDEEGAPPPPPVRTVKKQRPAPVAENPDGIDLDPTTPPVKPSKTGEQEVPKADDDDTWA